MKYLWIPAAVLLGVLALVLGVSYLCYRIAFYARRKNGQPPETAPLPQGPVYEPYHPIMRAWAEQVAQMPRKEYTVTSFDGLLLCGRYFEQKPGAVLELMFHGYRGSADRDMPGAVLRAFAAGHNALIVEQRCSGKSQGSTITFGIKERKDCLTWLEKVREEFGPQQPVILTGISMGAATVLMAAGQDLPEQVIGVLADCGYSDNKTIISHFIRQMKLSPVIAYPFVRLGARLFGGFDPEADSPLAAMKRCKVPVIFFHGQKDDIVPWQMSKACYEACATRKALVLIPEAGHGLAYPADPEQYLKALKTFYP